MYFIPLKAPVNCILQLLCQKGLKQVHILKVGSEAQARLLLAFRTAPRGKSRIAEMESGEVQ